MLGAELRQAGAIAGRAKKLLLVAYCIVLNLNAIAIDQKLKHAGAVGMA
ncbi:MAG: hypothetical protein HC886_00330 [Leptolyngbyaceae cyanobacterium SM1_1_3]|nr:hypothetical protein [Leptolyngbyaceae cyanobacterium SM1_1_3]